MKQKILITAALPYANGALHFGHIAGVYLPADCTARFERLRGNEVLFISGSDEYGVAITLSAFLAKRTPKEHVDLYHKVNQSIFARIQISFDHYSRTTSPFHTPFVHQFFLDLLANGWIEAFESEQLYDEAESRFLADRYVVGICPQCGFEEARGDECGRCGASYEATDLKNPRSKLSSAPLVRRKTRHWYLLLDKLKGRLAEFLEGKAWRPNVLAFVKKYLEEIRPRAITRDLEWGVPVPLKEAAHKVFYVWFDACIGYISATAEWASTQADPEAWRAYWLDPKVRYVQFIGKDNIPFHALLFPAAIMGQNQPYKQVDDLVASEFYNLEGRQFSKSEGWTIDLEEFLTHFSVDQLRYALAATAPETGDSDFSWSDFEMRCNRELVGKWGNLAHRVLTFIQSKAGGVIPECGPLDAEDLRFKEELRRLALEIEEQYAAYRLRKVCQLLMEFAHLGNRYFDNKAPWKQELGSTGLFTTLFLCLECLKDLALLSSPIIPEASERLWRLLGFLTPLEKERWSEVLARPLASATKLPQPQPLFQKVEEALIAEQIAKLRKNLPSQPQPPQTSMKELTSFDAFQKMDLRVGVVRKAEKIAKSEKLLQLEVDLGGEVRTIVSGISKHYEPEMLLGKRVAVLANLPKKKICGIESNGMILAASTGDKLEVLTVADLPPGAEIS